VLPAHTFAHEVRTQALSGSRLVEVGHGCSSMRVIRRSRIWSSPNAVLMTLVLSGSLLMSSRQAVCEELLIEGNETALHLDARDVPLGRLLDAMQRKFNLRYRTDSPLDSSVTGTYSGHMHQVAARLLANYDFVMRTSPEGLDVLIFRRTMEPVRSLPASKETAAASSMFQLTSNQILGVVLSGRLP